MTLLQSYHQDISRLCAAHQVKSLYAFGSILTGQFSEHSDVDLIVDFYPLDVAQYADNYYDLKFSLEHVLHRAVDLLEDQAIKNPYFKKKLEQQRQLIYGQ